MHVVPTASLRVMRLGLREKSAAVPLQALHNILWKNHAVPIGFESQGAIRSGPQVKSDLFRRVLLAEEIAKVKALEALFTYTLIDLGVYLIACGLL
jgi:hypothetical protein